MEMKDLRALSKEDRAKELQELLREQFNMRMQKATGQLSNTARFSKVRRDIARILTVMNEKTGVSG